MAVPVRAWQGFNSEREEQITTWRGKVRLVLLRPGPDRRCKARFYLGTENISQRWLGEAPHGMARPGRVCRGKARQGFNLERRDTNHTGQGLARHGGACLGSARQGKARFLLWNGGNNKSTRHGWSRHGWARPGKARRGFSFQQKELDRCEK